MDNIPPLIGISGKKQSGKDVAFEFIRIAVQNAYPNKPIIQLNFANALKQEVSIALGVSLEWIEEHKNDIRIILQGYGTEFRRKFFGDNYWIDKWLAGYTWIRQAQPDAIIVCTDVRFPNECDTLKELDAVLWYVVAYNKFLWEDDTHASENALTDYKWDSILVNDFHDINVLKEHVNKLLISKPIIT